MSVLLTQVAGAVVPPELLRRFSQVDPRLGVRPISYPSRDGINYNAISYWAITYAWAENDKRRIMIQRGDMPEDAAFDVLCWLPPDCSVHDAFNYFLRNLKGTVRERSDVQRILDRIHKFNEDVVKENMKETTELAEELIETNAPTLFAKEGKSIPKVFQSGPLKKGTK